MYLLDTNTLIFYIIGDKTLSEKARVAIEENICYFSYVSLWEIAIKQRLKKLDVPYTIEEIADFCDKENFFKLEVTPSAIEQTKMLPQIHRDPFDRLLVAQAQIENLTLITRDTLIPQYDVKTLW